MENKIVDIFEFRYLMQLGCGGDYWLPYGKVYGHPNFNDGHKVYTSTPVSFNEMDMIMTTASGRKYCIRTFESDPQKWIDQIKKDIANGQSEAH